MIAGSETTPTPSPAGVAQPQVTEAGGHLSKWEDALLAACCAGVILLPLSEIVLRATLNVGISGSSSLVQHLTLFIGMIGAMVAARQGRLLSLSAALTMLEGKWRAIARFISNAGAATIGTLLAIASLKFALAERIGGNTLAYGIPTWIVQLILPIGFGVIAIRLLHQASSSWIVRALAAGVVALVIAIGARPPASPASLLFPAMILLLISTIAGMPLFATLGGAAIILFWSHATPLAVLPIEHYGLVVNPTLPTIPLFTLAGYFLAEGGAARRLVNVFRAVVGSLKGGAAIVTVLSCAFFTSFTGASGVTILALGGLLMPLLLSAGYNDRNALGLVTGAGALGLLLPPCLPIILYAIYANVPIEQMFLGGLLPGMLLLILTAWWGIRAEPVSEERARTFNAREAGATVWLAKWELLLPVVAIVSLFSGLATPVEAAALTALYAFIVETFIYRDYTSVRQVVRVMTEAGLLVGGVLLILGVAMGFTSYLVDAEVPTLLAQWVTTHVQSKLLFLLFLNLFLIIVGALMDIYSAIVVVVPLIVPIGLAYGIDPVHLGIIFLANLELGFLTPPVGANVFLSAYRFNRPLPEVYRAVVPMMLVFLTGVLCITYFPPLTTMLPRLFSK